MKELVIKSLEEIVGKKNIFTEIDETEPFVVDWRNRYKGNAICVVLPANTDEVSQVMRFCFANKVVVVPQGGNTGLCEGSIPIANSSGSVVLNLRRLNKIIEIDKNNSSMHVEAGCVLANMQMAAQEQDLLYPVSLGSEGSCQIGGNIATNAGGTGVLRYGNTRDNILGLEVVLPDGRVWDGLYGLRKNNTGFDLKNLFIGSEGIIGIITAAIVKLHPLPKTHAIAWFTTGSTELAIEVLFIAKQSCAGVLSAYEMMNETELNIVIENVPGRRAPIGTDSPWHVLIELSDNSNYDTLELRLEELLTAAFERDLISDAVIAQTEQQRHDFWDVRHGVSEGNKKAGMGINTDCAVPLSKIPEFIKKASEVSNSLLPEAKIVIVSHLGDGNVHFIPMLDFELWNQLDNANELANNLRHAINEVAIELGGTFSAEHGIGQMYIKEMGYFKDAVELEIMQSIKQLFDPENILNPGRLLPPIN